MKTSEPDRYDKAIKLCRIIVLILISPIITIMAFLIFSVLFRAAMVSPGSINSYDEYRKKMVTPCHMASILYVDNKIYYAVKSPPWVNLLTLYSGSAVYIFNQDGIMEDWTCNIHGDNNNFFNKWYGKSKSIERIDIPDLDRLLREKGPYTSEIPQGNGGQGVVEGDAEKTGPMEQK